MKKFLLTVFVMGMALCSASAQGGLVRAKKIYTKSEDMSSYCQKGAVPEVNGRVVFTKDIEVAGKSKADLFKIVAAWMDLRFKAKTGRGDWREPNFFRNIEYAQVKNINEANGTIEAQGAEEMIFKNQALSKDYAHVFYQLDATVTDGKVSLKMHNIQFVYVGSQDTTRYSAEEMITDANAFNKKGQLSRANGKFRVKTIDLINEFADEIKNDCSK